MIFLPLMSTLMLRSSLRLRPPCYSASSMFRSHQYSILVEEKQGNPLPLTMMNQIDHHHPWISRRILNQWLVSDDSTLINAAVLTGCALEDQRLLNSVLSSSILYGRIDVASECLSRMIKCDIVPKTSHINTVLTALVRSSLSKKKKMIDKARNLYKEMLARGIYGDHVTLNVMMRACLKDGKPEEAEDYFREMKTKGLVELDAVLYNTVVEAVCKNKKKANNSTLACELLKEMIEEKGWVPSSRAYTSAIKACVKRGSMLEALRLKNEMVTNGLPANLSVFKSLMSAMVFSEYSDSALQQQLNLNVNLYGALSLFSEMLKRGITPDESTYMVMIEGCVWNGNMEKSYEIYTQMKSAGILPNAFIYNLFVKSFVITDRYEQSPEFVEVCNEAFDIGVANICSYNIILYWKSEFNMEDAMGLLDKMVDNGVSPNTSTYDIMIQGYCMTERDMDRAMIKFSEMLDEKVIRPTELTYSILMDWYFEDGKLSAAFDLHEKMVSFSNITPTDLTFNTIISGLCAAGRTSIATNMLRKFMAEDGFIPTTHMTYNSIIDGFMRREGSKLEAEAIYQEMRKSRLVSPDVVTYEILIKGYCNDGDMRGADKLFNELVEVGLTPNFVIYYSLISGYLSQENIDTALSMYKRMCEEGILPDFATYTILIDGLLQHGDKDQAEELYSELLRNRHLLPDYSFI